MPLCLVIAVPKGTNKVRRCCAGMAATDGHIPLGNIDLIVVGIFENKCQQLAVTETDCLISFSWGVSEKCGFIILCAILFTRTYLPSNCHQVSVPVTLNFMDGSFK